METRVCEAALAPPLRMIRVAAGARARLPRAAVLALDMELLSEEIVEVVLELVGVVVAWKERGGQGEAKDGSDCRADETLGRVYHMWCPAAVLGQRRRRERGVGPDV